MYVRRCSMNFTIKLSSRNLFLVDGNFVCWEWLKVLRKTNALNLQKNMPMWQSQTIGWWHPYTVPNFRSASTKKKTSLPFWRQHECYVFSPFLGVITFFLDISIFLGVNPRPFSVFRHLRQWTRGSVRPPPPPPPGVWKVSVVELIEIQ